MEIQLISFDFENSLITAFLDNVKYSIDNISNLNSLRTEINNSVPYDSKTASFQYDQDYHRCVKRVVITGMVSPPPEIDNEIAIIPLTDISAELSVEIELAIIEIQTEITEQIN